MKNKTHKQKRKLFMTQHKKYWSILNILKFKIKWRLYILSLCVWYFSIAKNIFFTKATATLMKVICATCWVLILLVIVSEISLLIISPKVNEHRSNDNSSNYDNGCNKNNNWRKIVIWSTASPLWIIQMCNTIFSLFETVD